MAERLSGSLADSEQKVFWLDSPEAPEPLPPLEGETSCELAIVGGGFTGLWAALLAAPDEDVLLLEGDRCGWAASGRNGGFLDASLTHGLENGLARWPEEMERLDNARRRELRRDSRHPRDPRDRCRLGGERLHRRRHPRARGRGARGGRRAGAPLRPRGGAARPSGCASAGRLAHLPRRALHAHGRRRAGRPGAARLGPARAALEDGVRIHEGTQVTAMRRDGEGVVLETPGGRVRASRVVLATNAFRPLVRSIGRYVIPVYDYVLVSRAARRRRGARRSAGRGARASPTRATASTTTGSPPTTASCGAATRRSTTGRTACARSSRRAPPSSICSPQLLRDLPAAGGPALHAPLGGGDRHQLALLRHLRDGARRARRLRRRLHGPGGGGDALRGARGARSRPRARHGANEAGTGAQPAYPVPTGAASLRGRPGHPARADPGRRAPRQARALAAPVGQDGRRLRQLTGAGRTAERFGGRTI